MPGLRLTIWQQIQGVPPDQTRYSIPWPRDGDGQPLVGTTSVLLHVDKQGTIASATLDRSSGHVELDQAALAAVQRWHLTPSIEGGVPVEFVRRVQITMDPHNEMTGLDVPVSFPRPAPATGASASLPNGAISGVANPSAHGAVADQEHDTHARYAKALDDAIRPHWPRPLNVFKVSCTIRITQIPGGEVIRAEFEPGCPYDAAAQKSVEDAVLQSSPLPYKGFESVWHRVIEFTFPA